MLVAVGKVVGCHRAARRPADQAEEHLAEDGARGAAGGPGALRGREVEGLAVAALVVRGPGVCAHARGPEAHAAQQQRQHDEGRQAEAQQCAAAHRHDALQRPVPEKHGSMGQLL